MERSDAAPGDCGVVVARRVALVHLPIVGGIVGGEAAYDVVPRSLGDDACGGYGEELAVALHDALVRDERGLVMEADGGVGRLSLAGLEIGVVGVETVAVDDEELRRGSEGADGAVHGQDAGVEDVETVNLLR